MKATLMQHQQDGVKFALKNNGVSALFHEVGCGKTITSLSIFEELRKSEPDLFLLVICPISLIHGAWVKEIEKWTDLRWFDLHRQIPQEGIKKYDVYLINFDSFVIQKRIDNLKAIIKDKKFMVIMDESSKIRNHAAITTKNILSLRSLFKYRIICTGCAAPNIEYEYWSQINFMNPSILPDNFYKFRNIFFNLQRGGEIIPGAIYSKAALREVFNKGYKYEFDERKREDFFNRLKQWCHMVKSKDCLDLPDFIDEYREIDMEPDQMRVYKEMKTQFIAEIKSELRPETSVLAIANIILTKILRLRQITSGFVSDENGQAHAVSKKNTKMQALLDIIEECGTDQMIIWCQFHWEIDNILKEIEKIGGVSQLHGRIPQTARINHIDDFISGKNRFLLAHCESAAHGLTFVNAHICVYFSLDFSYENYMQSRGRIHRHGQKNNCIYFHLIAKNSVDGDVLAVCQKKQDKQNVVEKWLKEIV